MNKKEEKRTKLRWGAFYCLLFAVFALMIACHKTPVPDPEPEQDPETPDTPQVIDTTTYPDTIWFKLPRLYRVPQIDSIRFYAEKNSVKKIILELERYNSTGCTPFTFHACRDSLQLRIDVAPSKVRGAGTIYVDPTFGAQLPDPTATNIAGMTPDDSVFFTSNGWVLHRGYPLLDK